MRIALAMVAFSSVALAARPADACSIFVNERFVVEPGQGGDATPPGAVTVVSSSLSRNDSSGMCTHEGVISLDVTATDDASDVGFQVTVVEGTLLPILRDGPIRPGVFGELMFYIGDLEPRYELDVSAVDRAGNVGPATRVSFIGDDGGGCAVGGAASPIVALALAGLVRRRRAR